MPRPPRNPFYAVLGVVGFAFTITVAASCVAVLRGLRPAGEPGGRHPFDRLLDEHGTTLLVWEIAILAVATVGAIWVDHVAGERIRRARAARETMPPDDTGADEP